MKDRITNFVSISSVIPHSCFWRMCFLSPFEESAHQRETTRFKTKVTRTMILIYSSQLRFKNIILHVTMYYLLDIFFFTSKWINNRRTKDKYVLKIIFFLHLVDLQSPPPQPHQHHNLTGLIFVHDILSTYM